MEGIICRNCHDKLLNLDKNAQKFWDQCQSTKSKSKRCFRELQAFEYDLNTDSGIFSPTDTFSFLFSPPAQPSLTDRPNPICSTPVSQEAKHAKKLNFTTFELDAPSPICQNFEKSEAARVPLEGIYNISQTYIRMIPFTGFR